MQSRSLLALAFVVVASACASSHRAGDGDAGPDGDGGVEIDAHEGLGWGEVCTDDPQCASSVCQDGHCSRTCDFDCPDGYACHTVSHDGGDLRVCVPAPSNLCATCTTDEECGDDGDLCVQFTGGKFCALDCVADPTVCPTGFTCQQVTSVDEQPRRQCMPLNGVCCIDADADRHGAGDGCLGADCDDQNDHIYNGNRETCDALDNDCVGGVDDNPLDCDPAMCELGALGYFSRAGDVCAGVAGCQQQSTVLCGLYTCDGGGEDGDACATMCDGEGDGKCIPSAHCDASVCFDDLGNGGVCDEGSDCESGHCQNGFCCADGDCCLQANDCPTFGTFQPVCDTPSSCQGSRGAAVCTTSNECTTQNGVPDDTACTATTEANDCGWWLPIDCTGAVNQTAPNCPTSCTNSNQCDAGGWCDLSTHTCREDLDDGQACATDDGRCKSDHCQNGYCCANGDCCAVAGNCPATYSSPPVCTSPVACDGEADVATCVASTCGTIPDVDDDAACGAGTLASDCGPYRPIFCTGSSTQTAPACATSCTGDTDCDANAYCNAGHQCVPDQPSGGVCQDAGECVSGHCQNGFCCGSGDCCAQSTDCGAYNVPSSCSTPSTCQGSRVDGVCNAAKQCTTATVGDDSGCGGIEANSCGPYPAQICTSSMTQSPPTCPTTCTTDANCDVSAHCTNGTCQPDQGPGGFCNATNECAAGQCVDNVCCSSACTGLCEACDLPGSLGTCTAVGPGLDPDNECGAQSCVGFYEGWSGDNCRRTADVPANVAACSGARTCRTQSVECNAYNTAGPVTTTCNGLCQDPNLATCTGTIAGTCNNVNPGNQTCGTGACFTTAPLCTNGAPAGCTPLPPTTESCNDVDDDCNGTIDDGNFSDGYEPNPDCGTLRTLNTAGSDQTQSYNTMTVYAGGDWDTYALPLTETDGSCGCSFPSLDEDYQIRVTVGVPAGAGTFEVCLNTNSCGWPAGYCFNVGESTSITLTQNLDGACGPGQTDNYTSYVRIRGVGGAGFECRPYTLSYIFDAGFCF